MREVLELVGCQALDPLALMIGYKFPSYNLRAHDRYVSKRVALYKEFTRNFVKDRIEQIKNKTSKKEDYVEKMYSMASE